jgi:hypothetical protein
MRRDEHELGAWLQRSFIPSGPQINDDISENFELEFLKNSCQGYTCKPRNPSAQITPSYSWSRTFAALWGWRHGHVVPHHAM